MSFCPFDSRMPQYKTPFGSVPAGGGLRFAVLLPRGIRCTGVTLVLETDSAGERKGLFWVGTDGETEWWDIRFRAPEPDVYFYHFEYDSPAGRGRITKSAGSSGTLLDSGARWQLTVYDSGFTVPRWPREGIFYQIFPDRFRFSGDKKKQVPVDRKLRTDWGGNPDWRICEGGSIPNNDYFQGDFKGIEEKLGYLQSLSVSCIYLNPICEAHSNHRYDTADYAHADPLLGTDEDFSHLCAQAAKYGIRILLDGVYSHTGADSIYFNKNGRYGASGAYQDRNSPYFSWYKFRSEDRDDYVSWWGVKILPEVDETNPSYADFITGKDGVARLWLERGAAGYRLDVADELPDEFIEKLRLTVKETSPDAFLAGEVWEDASNKISYGLRRRYLLGNELDSVMNYLFRNAIIDFLLTRRAEDFMECVMNVAENYPAPALHSMMNLIGSHDTPRILTVLAGGNPEKMSRSEQADFQLNDAQRRRGVTLLKAAAVLQYTLPGIPCVYYGDEAGLEGCCDPFNRRCFPWGSENAELTAHFAALGNLRRSHPVYQDGDIRFLSAALGCVAYERLCSQYSMLTIVNNNPHPIAYRLPPDREGANCLFGGSSDGTVVNIPENTGVILKKEF